MKHLLSLSIFLICLIVLSTFTLSSTARSRHKKSLFKQISEKDKLVKKALGDTSNVTFTGWLSISSSQFRNTKKYPILRLPNGSPMNIKAETSGLRINDEFKSKAKSDRQSPSTKYSFFFRLSGRYLYYTASSRATDINILGTMELSSLKNLENVNRTKKNEFCFRVTDVKGHKLKLCADTNVKRLKWVCEMEKALGMKEKNFKCGSLIPRGGVLKEKKEQEENKVAVQQVTQPVIIIPKPTRFCNQSWDYKNKGKDWECLCSEGRAQSPIDLPYLESAQSSPVKPLFEYERVEKKDGLKIVYKDYSLRIAHKNFGKIVTVNGTGYVAQEIVFKTPSEHTLNGKRFDMEMQVIHNARTQGDVGKTAVLSFLFKAKPGVYNKFIDKLDFFNLPNPIETSREIKETLFIPSILLNSDDEDVSLMPSFSFFTYEGSLTQPPCTESTIHYVASQPIELSTTALHLFKEALVVPEMEDSKGNIVINENVNDENYRAIQNLNGRSIFYYDSSKYECPLFKEKIKPKRTLELNQGHYEKRERTVTEYMFVNGEKPSGLPNAFVVSDKEALGKQ